MTELLGGQSLPDIDAVSLFRVRAKGDAQEELGGFRLRSNGILAEGVGFSGSFEYWLADLVSPGPVDLRYAPVQSRYHQAD